MQIVVNGQPTTLPDGATVAELIQARDLARQACAVEVNTRLVPKKHHSDHQLAEGDTVEIVTLVGGG